MNKTHSWSFSVDTIKKRLIERNAFFEKLVSENIEYNILKIREDKKSEYLTKLITESDTITALLSNKNSTTFSDEYTINNVWIINYIREYLFELNPSLNFEISDDINQHIPNCESCLKDLADIHYSYKTIIPISAFNPKEIKYEFKCVGLGISESFTAFIKKKVNIEIIKSKKNSKRQ